MKIFKRLFNRRPEKFVESLSRITQLEKDLSKFSDIEERLETMQEEINYLKLIVNNED